jgi:hypothetical protein
MGRPNIAPQNDVLNFEELAALRRRLSTMSMTALHDFYFAAYLHCRPENGSLPTARQIQELVQAWKQLQAPRKRTSG